MKIAIIGGGFLGNVLKKDNPLWHLFKFKELNCYPFQQNTIKIDFDQLDEYDVIINTVAQTNTRQCESKDYEQIKLNFDLNCVYPMYLSDYCKRHNKKYVHISTACLYREKSADGDVTLGRESDCIDPTTTYTLQKFYAEKSLNSNDLILRSRLFFGESESPSNLITKIKKFDTFSDATNSMTSVHTLSSAISFLIKENAIGFYNVVNEGSASLFELATLVGLNGKRYVPKEGEYRAPNLLIDISKIKEMGFNPPNLVDEFKRCWSNYE